eukprot:TRINITY_DN5510_c0_g2_i1.p1 TRINITY_DN5510_c0_g2~~TRINITY_DN5510_c0_g2_i1.p1  ORF type:complete len:149 (+),score=0.28 TRINITY_DN5510_c0_g2_i1:918-1364(+)
MDTVAGWLREATRRALLQSILLSASIRSLQMALLAQAVRASSSATSLGHHTASKFRFSRETTPADLCAYTKCCWLRPHPTPSTCRNFAGAQVQALVNFASSQSPMQRRVFEGKGWPGTRSLDRCATETIRMHVGSPFMVCRQGWRLLP